MLTQGHKWPYTLHRPIQLGINPGDDTPVRFSPSDKLTDISQVAYADIPNAEIIRNEYEKRIGSIDDDWVKIQEVHPQAFPLAADAEDALPPEKMAKDQETLLQNLGAVLLLSDLKNK
jgi:hypothetical protein